MISCLAHLAGSVPPSAHSVPGQEGLLAGLVHPVGGVDHLLAMLAVGLVSARRGRAWMALVPLLFVLGVVLGGVLGYRELPLPYAESGVAISVLFLGLATVLDRAIPTWTVVAPVMVFGVFHGYAHGAELPTNASALRFTIGFVIGTVGLHVMGVLLGMISNEITHGRRMITVFGCGAALTGFFFLLPVG